MQDLNELEKPHAYVGHCEFYHQSLLHMPPSTSVCSHYAPLSIEVQTSTNLSSLLYLKKRKMR